MSPSHASDADRAAPPAPAGAQSSHADPSGGELSADDRRRVIELLNDALSAEYHSFVGHALGSNPFIVPGTEKDLDVLDRIRDEENANTRALLVQLARYRAGPTLHAFRWWKHDLNFLGLDFLVIEAAEVAKQEIARFERTAQGLPNDPELRATFTSILATKKRHADELAKLAAVRSKERAARRAAAFATTQIPLKKPAPAAAAKPAGAAAAPAAPGAPKAPPLPGAPKAPPLPGAPKPPSPPLPPGASRPPSPPLPPGAPKPPSPPLPSGAPKPPSPPLPPGAPKPPSASPAPAPAEDDLDRTMEAPRTPPAKPSHPPLPPGFKLPPKP